MMPPLATIASPPPKFSIVVLTFNSEAFIVPCLESIAAVQYPDLEVIVVDNASSDKTVEYARTTGLYHILIPNAANRGCAGGYNDGWRASGGEIVLFLNPDTTVDANIAPAIAEAFAAHPDAAVCGCKILYPDARRTLWHAGGILHPNGMTGHRGKDEADTGQYESVCEIDYASGCAIAVRREALERFGGFNEDYWPGYFEEVDFCWRARRAGGRILYIPHAVVYHHESQSFQLHSPSFFHAYYRNRMRFVAYNYTFHQMLTRFLPFEYRWWRQVPEARGYRLRQLRYYIEGIYFYGRRRLRRKE